MNHLIVPHVGREHLPKVLAALAGSPVHGWEVHVEELDEADPTSYWRCMAKWWARCAADGSDLMVVEHDVVIHESVFTGFDCCDNTKCAFTYWIGASYRYGLGCTRFRHELIAARPDTLEQVGRIDKDGLPIRRHWKRMDTRMWDVLGAPCVHEPHVKHLHDYPMKEPEW